MCCLGRPNALTLIWQVDTPASQQRQRLIPDTTLCKLEGFCLNTPLTLSQALGAEVSQWPDLKHDCSHVYMWVFTAAAACCGYTCRLQPSAKNCSNTSAMLSRKP